MGHIYCKQNKVLKHQTNVCSKLLRSLQKLRNTMYHLQTKKRIWSIYFELLAVRFTA